MNVPFKLNDSYYVGITGFNEEVGNYALDVNCNYDKSFQKNQSFCQMESNEFVCKCHGDNKCRNLIIECHEDINCKIECFGDNSCDNAVIIWPFNGTRIIQCDGILACHAINFPVPPKDKDLTINCNKHGECQSAIIICPSEASCTIKCNSSLSCYNTQIIWSTNLVESILECNDDSYGPCSNTIPP
eukprot:205532_1